MKSVKELLEAKTEKAINPTSPKTSVTKSPNVPSVIILRRKAIRQFPDNQKIVLYYSDALDKYVSVPFGPDGEAQGISLSEDYKDYLPGYRSSEKQFKDDINTAKKEGIVGSVKKFVKRDAIKALGAAPIGKGITAATQLGQRGAAVAGNLGSKVLSKYRSARLADRGKVALRKSKRYGRDAALAGIGFAAALDGGGNPYNERRGGGSNYGATDYRETNYKVKTNSSTVGDGPQLRRNWDELEKARTKRIWNSGSYSPSSSSNQVYENIKDIAKSGKAGKISIGENSIEITPRIANRICECHAILNTKNQKNFEAMLNESVPSLKKIIDFSIRKGK